MLFGQYEHAENEYHKKKHEKLSFGYEKMKF